MADSPRSPAPKSDIGDYPGAPRWVKLSAIIVFVVVIFVILLFSRGHGGHGPGRHLSLGETGDSALLSSVTADHRSSGGGLGAHTPSEHVHG
ncbi:MAG: hypothetical protein GEU90_19565 [Gemmatimonas sp.]|nr:hypothetical protein [Gemmatimonas sp.]